MLWQRTQGSPLDKNRVDEGTSAKDWTYRKVGSGFGEE
jgi:hypothetical protein